MTIRRRIKDDEICRRPRHQHPNVAPSEGAPPASGSGPQCLSGGETHLQRSERNDQCHALDKRRARVAVGSERGDDSCIPQHPGGCLIEGTTLSEGRGTTRPFELWGAPGLDVGALLELDLHGVTLRPVEIVPTFHKHAGVPCAGVQVHVTDPWVFRPYETYLRMLAAVLPAVPAEERWRTEEYEFVSDRPAIDLLTGGPELRNAVDEGASIESVLVREARGAAEFDGQRRAAWLYEK